MKRKSKKQKQKTKGKSKRMSALVLALVLLTGSMDVPALATENKPEAVSVSANDMFGNYSGQNDWKEQREQQEQQEQNAPQESTAGTEDITAEKADDTSTYGPYGPYGLLVGGVIVNADNAKDVFGDGTVSYDAASSTLTLKNANITGGTLKMDNGNTPNYGIFMRDGDANLNIILEGENFVSAQEEQTSHGIAVVSKLTISGSGSMVIRGSDAIYMSTGIYAGSLLISGTVNVSVQSGMSEENVSFGIYSYGEEGITISEHAKVTVQCGSGEDLSYGIFAESGINFLDSCIVEATAPYDATNPMAITTYRGIVIEQGSTITADGLVEVMEKSQIDGTLNGLVFEYTEGVSKGRVYGNASIGDCTIGEGGSLTIPEGTTLTIHGKLTVPEGATITNNGTVQLGEGGSIENNSTGSITCGENAVHPVDENYKCQICGMVCGHTSVKCATNDKTDVIIAECVSCQSASGSMPVTVAGGVYTGKTYSVTCGTPTGILTNEKPVISYCCTGGCKNAGQHTASIKIKGQTVSVKFTITKAKAEGKTVSKIYLYSEKHADSINLGELLPADCGTVAYGKPAVTGKVAFDKAPAVSGQKLTYTVKPGSVNDTGSITIDATTQNYENIKLTVNLKLDKNVEGQLPAGTRSTLTDTQKQITSANTDKKDVADSVFSKLQLKATGKNKAVKLTWKKVKNADGYIIYGARCGKSLKKIKTIKKASTTSYTHKKLKKAKYYKYVVVAYKKVDGKNYVISTSKSVHAVTNGGKYGNPTKVSVKASKISVKKGGKKTIKPTLKLTKNKKNKVHIAKFRYESSNTKVATVTSKGVVKGKKKGTAYIYVYTQNGVCKRVKVTVK